MDPGMCNGVRAYIPRSLQDRRQREPIFDTTGRYVFLPETGLVNTFKKTRKKRKRHRKPKKGKRAGKRRRRLKSERVGFNNIRLLNWNCASFRRRRPIIDKLAMNTDILVLQETQLGESVVNMEGFVGFYNRRHCGQAIFVNSRLKPEEYNIDHPHQDDLQVHAVKVHIPAPLVIVNVYACNGKINTQGWDALFAHKGTNIIFCGDFNARGRQWGNIITNKQGEDLEEVLMTTDLMCLNNGEMTRQAGRPGDSDGAIDLAIASPILATKCRWMTLGYHGSDHFPCVTLIKKSEGSRKRARASAFKYNKTDDDTISRIRRNKPRKTKIKSKIGLQPPWWNTEVEAAWKNKRQAVKKWQKIRASNAEQTVNKAALKRDVDLTMERFQVCARKAKGEKWAELCHKISIDKSLKLFWQLQKKMTGTQRSRSIPDFQTEDLIWHRSDESKGRAFLTRYREQTDQNDIMERRVITEAVSNLRGKLEITEEQKITVEVIRATLEKSKNSAPGPDGVTYDDIRQLSDKELTTLAQEFNTSIQDACIKEEWLHSYLIPLHKPNKSQSRINGYRIIALQNTVGKLLEKIIAREITTQLEQAHKFPATLGGYRQNRVTWLNAAVFAQDVYEGFQEREETCAVALDLEDAYNRVNFGHLIHLLVGLELDPQRTAWIAVALKERKVALRCGEWTSEAITISPGLPQGSPLSPVLYNIYTLAITAQQLTGQGRTLSYADDILVYRRGKDRSGVIESMESEINRIADWCEESNSKINPEKATATWFSLNNRTVKTDMPMVKFKGEGIPRTTLMTYLGVRLDRSLCFNAHIEHILTKARKGLAAMRVMAAANMEQRLLVLLFQGLVIAPIEYAAAIMTITSTQMEKLERIQNEAMRIILGCTRDTTIVSMRYLLDFPTVANRIEVWRAKAYIAIIADNQHPLHHTAQEKKGDRLKRGKSWLGRAQDIVQEECDKENITMGPEWVGIPPEKRDMFCCITTLTKAQHPTEIQAEVKKLIDQRANPSEVVIFTDGSVQRHHRSAWAFTASVAGDTIQESNGAYAMTASSFTMETMAATMAFRWLETQKFTDACLLSDSLNMIAKIQAGYIRSQWNRSLQMSTVERVTFIYVPGHVGVLGNERADYLAGTAALRKGKPMDHRDIINNLSEKGREKFYDHTDTSLARMKELEVKCGIAKNERSAGRERRITNQHRTGTISRFTLMEILRRRSEHLWSCPMCRDDDPQQ